MADFTVICEATDRPTWLSHRLGGIGSSDACVILGLNPWRTPLSLYAEKIGLEDGPDENEAMYWGSAIEPLVIRRFAEITGRKCVPAGKLLRSVTRPWQQATLDAEQTAGGKPGVGVLEIKCTGLRENWNEGVPDYVMAQVQHQLAVTGYRWASVGVLFNGREFLWSDVERDEDFINRLIEVEADFWRRVSDLEPPDPAASEVDRKIIAQLWPKDAGEPIVLDGSFIELDERREELRAEEKRIHEELLGIENRIKAAMKDAATAALSSGVVYSLKLQHRKETILPASSFRVLRRKAPK